MENVDAKSQSNADLEAKMSLLSTNDDRKDCADVAVARRRRRCFDEELMEGFQKIEKGIELFDRELLPIFHKEFESVDVRFKHADDDGFAEVLNLVAEDELASLEALLATWGCEIDYE